MVEGTKTVEVELDEFTPAAIREAYVVRFGPTCAAWLVRDLDRRRKRSRKPFEDVFDMHLPAGVEEPAWFQVALECLRRRKRWVVVVQTCRGEKRYRLRFVSGIRKKELPTSIRRVT